MTVIERTGIERVDLAEFRRRFDACQPTLMQLDNGTGWPWFRERDGTDVVLVMDPFERIADLDPGDDLEPLRPFRRHLLNPDEPAPPPALLVELIYGDGMLNVLQSEPGVGKTWLATWIAAEVMDQGRPVIYMDEEGGPELVEERLHALGVSKATTDALLHYFPFEARSWNEDDLLALDQLIARVPDCALAVLDSLPDFLEAAGGDEDKAKDVTRFVNRVCRRFRKAGISQLLLDHLSKPPASARTKTKSRYSRGSGSKLGKADATLLLETVDEFDVDHSGKLRLWKTKDRRGRLPLPGLAKAGLDLIVNVEAERIGFRTQQPEERPQWDGPTECMKVVTEVLEAVRPEGLSGRGVETRVRLAGQGFRAGTIRDALLHLDAQGMVTTEPGRNRAVIYKVKGGASE